MPAPPRFIPKPFSADDLTGALRVHLEGDLPDARLITHEADYPPDSGLLSNVRTGVTTTSGRIRRSVFTCARTWTWALMHVKAQ